MQETLDCILATDAVQSKHTNESFERKYKIQLPIPTYEEFVAFDKRLAEDKKYRTAFVSIKMPGYFNGCDVCSGKYFIFSFIFRCKRYRESSTKQNLLPKISPFL